MSVKEMAFRIEDLENQAMKIHSLQNALFEAIYNGNNAVKTYEWVFVVLGELTLDMREEMKVLTNNAFNLINNEKK